jgi:hypothetical protein
LLTDGQRSEMARYFRSGAGSLGEADALPERIGDSATHDLLDGCGERVVAVPFTAGSFDADQINEEHEVAQVLWKSLPVALGSSCALTAGRGSHELAGRIVDGAAPTPSFVEVDALAAVSSEGRDGPLGLGVVVDQREAAALPDHVVGGSAALHGRRDPGEAA